MINYEQAIHILVNGVEEEYEAVRQLLEYSAELYYNTSNLILSNKEYDELNKLYRERTGEFLYGTPKGIPHKGMAEVSHKYENLAGTLEKVNSVEEFSEWYEKICKTYRRTLPLLVTEKFDGNSLVIEYKNGKPKKALTRGKDGKGVDLTDVFRDNRINYTKDIGVKYEVIIEDDNFKKLCEVLETDYVNPRTIVSGILGRDDAYKYSKYLTLVPLEIRTDNELSREDSLELMEVIFGMDSLIFSEIAIIEDENWMIESNVEHLRDIYDNLTHTRKNLPYMIDGLVIEILDENVRKDLGRDPNGTPKFAVALKFPYLEEVTEVTGMDYCFGDSGRITPRVHFKPVKFMGTTHTKQNLHNYKRFKELGLGIGSKILVEYRNDVLTYVNKLDTEENNKVKKFEFPKICPECKQPSIKIRVNEYGEETFAYCDNPKCEGKIVGRIQNYLTKMNLKGFKENTIVKLKEEGILKSIEDLYTMDYTLIRDIEGLGKKTEDNIKKLIQGNKEFYDYELLGSIGIENISTSNAKQFCRSYSLKDVIKNKSYNNSSFISKIIDIQGFSNIQANNLIKGIMDNIDTIEFLLNELNIKSYKDEVESNLQGDSLKIVLTGFRDPFIQAELERRGHKIVSAVSKNTNILACANKNLNTVKIQKARELGIEILTKEELVEKFNLA